MVVRSFVWLVLIENGGPVLIVFPIICIVVGVIGALRYLTGIESLAGLLLITWSASFLYIEMVRYWEIE